MTQTAVDTPVADYYELLQLSPHADPDTVHRVFRLLAQRLHPDNLQTGNAAAFRDLYEAYSVLSDPEKRAQYDVAYQKRQPPYRVPQGADGPADHPFELEQITRMMVLEALYDRRRVEPQSPGIFNAELETMTGRPREHLEFTVWYLIQKKFVQRTDNSRLMITAEGVDHLEQNHRANLKRRLTDNTKA